MPVAEREARNLQNFFLLELVQKGPFPDEVLDDWEIWCFAVAKTHFS